MKTIGLLVQSFEHSHGVRKAYLHYFSQFGKVAMVMPWMTPEDIKVDLLVLPGGADLTGAIQTNGYSYQQGSDDPSYTEFAAHNLSMWIKAEVPIFGICLGFQMLLQALGVPLERHIANHTGTEHLIAVREDEMVGLGAYYTPVNSRHHQGYMLKTWLEACSGRNPEAYTFEIIPLAVSLPGSWNHLKSSDLYTEFKKMISNTDQLDLTKVPVGATVEAFRSSRYKIAGVQWHPEDLVNQDNVTFGDYVSDALIEWLTNDGNYEDNVFEVDHAE